MISSQNWSQPSLLIADRKKPVPKVAEKMPGIILTGSKLLHSNLFLHYVKYLGQASFSNCS